MASCFGVYADPDGANAVITHGELEIAKLSLDGDIVWSVGGADIFFELGVGSALVFQNHTVTIRDWNSWTYTIDTVTGEVSVQKPGEAASSGER